MTTETAFVFSWVKETKNAWKAKGKIFYGPTKSEVRSLKFRRSLYFARNISKGASIKEEDINVLRPAVGIEPKFLKKILNKKVKRNIKKGTPVKWNSIKS